MTPTGGQVLAQTVEKGYTAVEPKSPVKTGYEFKGWTLDGKSFNFTTPITANITLKATWEKLANTALVTFDSNGGTSIAPKAVEKGSTITAPTAPTRDGYVFKGWMLNDQAFTFDNPITTDITLVATWEWTGVRVKNEAELREALLAEEANILIAEDFVLSDYITLTKPVTIDGNGKKVTVMFPGADNGDSGFMIKSAGVTLRDLTLESGETAKKDMALVYIHSASGREEAPIVIEGCTLLCEQNTVGILSTYNAGDYLVIKDNYISDSKCGMYFNEIDNSLIEGNTIDRTKYNGIMIAGDSETTYPCENIVVKNNTLKNIATADYPNKTYATGIYVGINSAEVTVADSNDVDMYISANPEIHFEKDGVLVADETQLKKAINDGKNVILCSDIELGNCVTIKKNNILNLNGHNIIGGNTFALYVNGSDVTITGNGEITVSEGIARDKSVIFVGYGDNPSKLTVDKDVTIKSDYSYGVTGFGPKEITIIIDGTVMTKVAPAISGNGSSGMASTDITINGTVETTDENAIYHPQAGKLTINGTVKGLGGIEAKSGTTVIFSENANVEATAESVSHEASSNGCSTSGYAIVAVENDAYSGNPKFDISAGTFIGPIGIVVDNNVDAEKKASIVITGGRFSTDPFDYVEENCFAEKNSDGIYTVEVKNTRELADDGSDNNIFSTINYAANCIILNYEVSGYYEGLTCEIDETTRYPKGFTFDNATITLSGDLLNSNGVTYEGNVTVTLNGKVYQNNNYDIVYDFYKEGSKINDTPCRIYTRIGQSVNTLPSSEESSGERYIPIKKVIIEDDIITNLTRCNGFPFQMYF